MIMEGDWKLIHYHEDGHDELYNLGNDIGEQNDVIAKESKRARIMRKKLDDWLKQTKAKFPIPDPKFDKDKEKPVGGKHQNFRQAKTGKTTRFFSRSQLQPNKDWWGSSLD